MRKHLLPTSLLLAACAVAAPAAHADSIAFVKDGDAWLSSPDGARQQRVTTTGDVHYVSIADDGTMVALVGGEKLRKLSPTGRALAEFATYVSDGGPQGGPVNQFAGPFDPEISPDGSLVAFEWFNSSFDNKPGCSETSVPPCYVLTSRQGVGVTRSDAFTGFEDYGLMTGWIGPQWLGNDRLLRSDAGTSPNEDAVFTGVRPGAGDDDLDRWFWDDRGAGGLREVRLSRDHKVAAGIASYEENRLRVYRTVVEPFGAPDQDLSPFAKVGSETLVEPCTEATATPEMGKFENLWFSPDGRQLTWSANDGIYVADLPDLSAGCGNPTGVRKLVDGGHHPHWTPADIPPASAFEAPKGPDGPVSPTGSTTLRATAAKSTKTRIAVVVTTNTAGTATVVARRGTKTVAKAARKVAAGRTRVTLKVSKAGRRALRKGGTVKVKVTLAGASTTTKVRVKR